MKLLAFLASLPHLFMVASLPHLFMVAWSWVIASDVRSMIALGIVTAAGNAGIRFFTSKEWSDWCTTHPRIVGIFLVLKGVFPEGGTIARGLVAFARGRLRERSKTVDAQRLYEAYGDHADWKNYQGLPMPKWDELPEAIRLAWGAAALRAKDLAS